jgi:hypothetical protein
MTIMTTHGSATALQETPHASETVYASETNTTTSTTKISDALRRRAHSVISDNSIDPRWRAVIRYGLEINDPWLADLVRRADAGEPITDTVEFTLEPETLEYDASEDKIERLAEIICGTRTKVGVANEAAACNETAAGSEAAAALFVLMGTLENSTHPKLLANAAKHFAFTRCAELNLFGMVDAQVALVEGELLAGNV